MNLGLSQLKEHKRMLEDILTDINNSLKVAESRLDYCSSRSKFEKALIDRWTNPSNYYHMQFMDMAVEIVRDMRFPKKLVFHVRCHNFNCNDFVPKPLRFYFNSFTDYGMFETPMQAFELFCRCCNRLSLLQLGRKAPQQLELNEFDKEDIY